MAKKTITLYDLKWLRKHPDHFTKNSHDKQITHRDRHLVKPNNKDGYDK